MRLDRVSAASFDACFALARAAIAGLALVAFVAPTAAQDAAAPPAKNARRPNVVLVISDDQGYGDLGCHGNEMLKTPRLDRLHDESVRLLDFHVDSTCSPTRSALLTGKYSTRVGVWHTIAGRSLLRPGEKTLAEAFAGAGYRTGIFGKWHLGDNAPLRPQDRGFQESLVHRGGGVGQTPDWGNDYFDDVYLRNGKPEQERGYCTDVFFDAAIDFVETHRERPFFCYVATNAPHAPYRVADEYAKPYREAGVPEPMATFYGMIANLDRNVGRLLDRLDELKLSENTIVVFMTDNGTAAGWTPNAKEGWRGFNAGRRDKKGSQYDGGHRVPCFVRWPGELAPRIVIGVTAHFDLFPTFASLCGLDVTGIEFDGANLADALRGRAEVPERTLFVHTQRIETPEKWRLCAAMTHRWRLVDGRELYDVALAPGQQRDVAAEHPQVVAQLRAEYEKWWASLEPRFSEVVSIALGDDREPVARLCCHDWHAANAPSDSERLAQDPLVNGWWAVEPRKAGRYEFTLRRRPEWDPAPINAVRAAIEIGDQKAEAEVAPDAPGVVFTLKLPAGPTRLSTTLTDAAGKTRGAYYVDVRFVD